MKDEDLIRNKYAIDTGNDNDIKAQYRTSTRCFILLAEGLYDRTKPLRVEFDSYVYFSCPVKSLGTGKN